MRKQPFVLIIILILGGIVIVGCRVKSAAEDAEPTKSNNVVISYNSDTGQGNTNGDTVTQEATDEIVPTDTVEPTPTLMPTETNTPFPTIETPGVILPTSTQAGIFPTDTQAAEVVAIQPTNTATIFVPPSNTFVPTHTTTPIPTDTATPVPPTDTPTNTPPPTNTSTVTSSPTPLITPTITPFEAIGGGAPTVIAQEGTPSDGLNANQQTATAFWSQHTATAEAALGTITVPSPGAEIGTTPGVPTPSGIGTPDFEECEHYVDPGATLSQIARLYNNLDINYIASFNNLDNVDYIKAGTILIIPGCGQPISTPIPTVDPLTESAAVPQPDPDNSQGPVQYTVQVGDNIYRLSVRFGVSMAELLNANPIIRDTDINLISVGQSITIPRRSEVTTTTDTTIPTLTVTPNQGGTVG